MYKKVSSQENAIASGKSLVNDNPEEALNGVQAEVNEERTHDAKVVNVAPAFENRTVP